ncbi:MAG TPA: hypothetical protein VJY86_00555 [Bacilli bacterium]|nr:hypothetical protein [Bacilli bacterium]
MKKLSSVFYMWFGFGSAIVSVLAMFLPFITMDSGIKPATFFFFDGPGGLTLGAWPAFIGFMLILLAGLALGVMGLPFFVPTAKVEKIVLISSLVSLVIGLALVASIGALYVYLNTEYIAHPSSPIIIYYHAGYYISLLGAALAAVANFIALKLDW